MLLGLILFLLDEIELTKLFVFDERPNSYLLGSISRTYPGLMLIWCLPSWMGDQWARATCSDQDQMFLGSSMGNSSFSGFEGLKARTFLSSQERQNATVINNSCVETVNCARLVQRG